MAFDDRLQFLLLGMAIGFVLGYLVRLVRDIKEELDEVDEIVKKELGPHDRGEGGFMRIPLAADIAILLVVGLTAWASFVSQKASNDVQNTQDRIERIILCNQNVLTATLDSLNERSTFTKESVSANIDLQQSQSNFLTILLHNPPYSEAKRAKSIQKYFEDLQRYLSVANKNRDKIATNPLPTLKEFTNCLDSSSKGAIDES